MNPFPILYLNLGGELVYIIEQRLQAQNIVPDKAGKVLNDIISTMLNRQFVADMFRPGQLSPPSAMKALMEKIVHASIMRLGPDSLEKLFDLMFMAVKFQCFAAPDPSYLLEITLTHVNSWKTMTHNPEIILQVQNAQNLLIDHFKPLPMWTWMNIRHTLLNYLQPSKIRVTVFLKSGFQSPAGFFYTELKRPLPDGFALPPTQPYDEYREQIFEPELIATLGSNMFNDSKRNQQIHSKTISTPLDGLMIPSTKIEESDKTSTEQDSALEAAVPSSTQWESLQLQMTCTEQPEVETRKPVLEEETLLDLFDQASLLG